MIADTVLVKTVRGREEVRVRAHTLTALQRWLLILADGRRRVSDIAALLDCGVEDPSLQEALECLHRDRYVDRLQDLERVA